MKHKINIKGKIVWLACTLVLAIIGLIPLPLIAQSPCAQVVVDGAGVFKDRSGDVEEAAAGLINAGADVRVRTILTFGSSGNLDRYEADLEKQCPSWLDAEGNRKNNLVVIMVALSERKSGIYYGSQWESLLESRWIQIQTEKMNPRFAEGDYAGGMIAGIKEIQSLIKGQSSAQQTTGSSGGTSAGWIILTVFLVIIGIFVLLAGLLIFRSQRKSREKRQAVQQKALLAKQGAASKVNDLVETVQLLEIKVNSTAAKVSPEDAAPLIDGLGKAKRLVDQGSQTYSELGHSAGDPESPKLTETQLGVVEQEYQKVLSVLREAGDAVKQVETGIDTLQKTAEGFTGKAYEVKTGIEAAQNRLQEAQKVGFKDSASASNITRANNLLDQANASFKGKQLTQAVKSLDQASGLATQVIRSIDELPRKKEEAENAILELSSRIEQVKERISVGRTIFEKLVQEYADTNWESIRGNGTEAENRVNWALESVNNARIAAGPEQQAWPEALEFVGKGNTWMTEAESMIKSIIELEVNLKAARRDAPGEISAAQTDISKAWEYIYKYDNDIRESLEDDLRTAENNNRAASEEAAMDRPDYFKICKLARDSNSAADKILEQARSEHEAAERLRVKLAGARRDALARVNIAQKYIENHGPVVRNEARSFLNNALEALRQSDVATEINTQISQASKAESAADQAYSLAQRDVEGNWQYPGTTTGIPHGPTQVRPPIIIVPPMGHSSSSNNPWGTRRNSGSGSGGIHLPGGGGSTGWSSRGGGSFGGGSRGGGGSTGW